MRLVLASCCVALMGVGCAHTVTNEERLDGLTDTVVEEVDVGKLRCRETSPEIQIARDASRKKSERVSRFQSAVADAKAMQAQFDEAFRKDPDLLYGDKGEEWKRRQAFCGELVVTLEREKARVDAEIAEAAPAAAAPAPVAAAAPDEAFEDDADQARSTYKKKSASKAKLAKASSKKSKKAKKRSVSLAAR